MHQRSDWRRVLLGDVVRPTTLREIPPATTELPFIGMKHVLRAPEQSKDSRRRGGS